jgi:hypothetical protein
MKMMALVGAALMWVTAANWDGPEPYCPEICTGSTVSQPYSGTGWTVTAGIPADGHAYFASCDPCSMPCRVSLSVSFNGFFSFGGVE